MKEPTKADLAAAVAKLTEENAGLRDLLAAVSLAAGTVPVSKGNNHLGEWKRSTKVLASIKAAGDIDDSWGGYLAWAASHLREVAAEPVGYEVYVAFKDAPVITCSERTCDAKHPQTGDWCVKEGLHDEHRDTYDGVWPAGQGGVLFNVGDEDEPASNPPHHAAEGERACTAPGWKDDSAAGGYVCTAQDGHDGPDHIAYKGDDGEYHRWPMRPAGDEGEPCPAYHYGPDGTQLPCMLTHQYGSYGVADVSHLDADGTVFRVGRCQRPGDHGMPRAWCTERSHHAPDAAGVLAAAIVAGTPVTVTDDEPRCECSHQQTLHDEGWDSRCNAVACGCNRFRSAPASVSA